METQVLTNAGILDLGGEGELILEIEFTDQHGEHKEAFYRLPDIINEQDIVNALILHPDGQDSTLMLEFNQLPTFRIDLHARCMELLEVRLPEAVGGEDITHLIVV